MPEMATDGRNACPIPWSSSATGSVSHVGTQVRDRMRVLSPQQQVVEEQMEPCDENQAPVRVDVEPDERAKTHAPPRMRSEVRLKPSFELGPHGRWFACPLLREEITATRRNSWMRSTARCRFSVEFAYDNRKYPSPAGPNEFPASTATPASSRSLRARERES